MHPDACRRIGQHPVWLLREHFRTFENTRWLSTTHRKRDFEENGSRSLNYRTQLRRCFYLGHCGAFWGMRFRAHQLKRSICQRTAPPPQRRPGRPKSLHTSRARCALARSKRSALEAKPSQPIKNGDNFFSRRIFPPRRAAHRAQRICLSGVDFLVKAGALPQKIEV